MVQGGHQKKRGGASIGKAITLVSAEAKNWRTGKSRLWTLWTSYKDVAHLAAAASLVCAEVRYRIANNLITHPSLDLEQISPFEMTMLMPDLVLAVAIDFQRAGLAIDGDATIEPVLAPETLWRIPTDLNIEPMRLPSRKLTGEDLQILNARRAGNRGRANRNALSKRSIALVREEETVEVFSSSIRPGEAPHVGSSQDRTTG